MSGYFGDGIVGDGKDVVVEVLGVMSREEVQVAGGIDSDGLLAVDACEGDAAVVINPELELGVGVVLAFLAGLQVRETPACLPRDGAVGVAAQHKIDNGAFAEAFSCFVGGSVGEQDGGVALPGRFQPG